MIFHHLIGEMLRSLTLDARVIHELRGDHWSEHRSLVSSEFKLNESSVGAQLCCLVLISKILTRVQWPVGTFTCQPAREYDGPNCSTGLSVRYAAISSLLHTPQTSPSPPKAHSIILVRFWRVISSQAAGPAPPPPAIRAARPPRRPIPTGTPAMEDPSASNQCNSSPEMGLFLCERLLGAAAAHRLPSRLIPAAAIPRCGLLQGVLLSTRPYSSAWWYSSVLDATLRRLATVGGSAAGKR